MDDRTFITTIKVIRQEEGALNEYVIEVSSREEYFTPEWYDGVIERLIELKESNSWQRIKPPVAKRQENKEALRKLGEYDG